MKLLLSLFVILTLAGPLWLIFSGQINFHGDYRTANRESAHLAPDPATTPEAIIQVYSAPAFNWRKIFSGHTWLAVKPKNAEHYIVYQVVGWRMLRGLPVVVAEPDLPDRYWFDEKPKLLLDLRGEKAEKLIPEIAAAVLRYPYDKEYRLWPGPNSNSFTAAILREAPELKLALPSNSLGKDYLPNFTFFAAAPSGTGYQFSFFGLFGLLLAWQEGIEFSFLGVVYGFSPQQGVIKLPGFGDLHLGSQ